jgi:hypothetical protein
MSSLTSDVRAFFEANPDEALTTADVVAKFAPDRLPKHIYHHLRYLRVSGWIALQLGEVANGRGRPAGLWIAGPRLRPSDNTEGIDGWLVAVYQQARREPVQVAVPGAGRLEIRVLP